MIPLDEFAAFCRAKGNATFDYGNTRECALAQFLSAKYGRPVRVGGYTFYFDGESTAYHIPSRIREALHNAFISTNESSFAILATELSK